MQKVSVTKALLLFFAALGVLFLLLFTALVLYLAIKKPFGIKVQNIPSAIIKAQSGTPTSTYDHPLLTTEQESTLESLGVDTKTLPTTITPTLAACFTAKLGPERVKEIESGSSLTVNDYFKTQSCIQ